MYELSMVMEELSAAGVDLIGCDDLDAFVGFAASARERP